MYIDEAWHGDVRYVLLFDMTSHVYVALEYDEKGKVHYLDKLIKNNPIIPYEDAVEVFPYLSKLNGRYGYS